MKVIGVTMRGTQSLVAAMRLIHHAFLSVLTLALLCAACQRLSGGEASLMYQKLELKVDERFDSADDWLTYESDAGLLMAVERGAYRIRLNQRQYSWTQLPSRYDDSVVEAEVALFDDENAGYAGLACRLDPGNSGRGYYFLMSGDGHFSLRWGNGRSLDVIIAVQFSGAIKQGNAVNRMRAVCIGDYLALWVNGEFIAEARDHRADSGTVGLAAVLNRDGATMEAAFDDLKIWRAAAYADPP